MSLQVWLPLNKNTNILENQGLSEITWVSGYTPLSKNNGKIGNYSLDLSSRVVFDCEKLLGKRYFTIAFWAKINVDTNLSTNWVDVFYAADQSSTGAAGSGLRWESCYASNYVNRGISAHNNSTYYIGYPWGADMTGKGTWHHVAMTVSNTAMIEYIDGIEVHRTTSLGTGALKGRFWIGETNLINGEMNDLRIYDEPLSAFEIKRISQGLILHYPLNDKYIESTTNLAPASLQNHTVNGTNDAMTIDISVSAGGSYTMSGYIKREVTSDVWVSPRITFSIKYTDNTSTTATVTDNLIKDGSFHYFETTVTVASGKTPSKLTGWVLDHSSGTTKKYVTVMGLQIENKDHATPYTPTSRNETIEYDCSGYNNNGIRHGTFVCRTGAPRHSLATYAAGNASTYLEGPILPLSAQTVSLWIKANKSTNGAIFNDKVTGLQIGLLNSLIYMNSLASTAGFTTNNWINGEWNHVVVVNNNGTRSVYVNGQTETQSGASNYYIHNVNNCWIWNRSYNNNYPFTGELSDLRIYTTALSAADVQQLYKDQAFIGTDGTFYTYEYEEE